jgi:O-methyltransferase
VLRRLLEFKNPQSREEVRFSILRTLGKLIMPGYRFTWPSLAWWRDPEFNAFFERYGEIQENMDRRWMLYQLALMSTHVPGDTAECGVWQGAGSYLICKATQSGAQQRTHFLFDSFQGVSAPDSIDGFGYWRKGDLSCSVDQIKRPDAKISIHPGWIPERFNDVADRRFSFVHIDVDLHQPTADSMSFFYPRMNPGGLLVCDDYGFMTCPGAKKAVDDFMADKPETIVQNSCGSAFLIKQG